MILDNFSSDPKDKKHNKQGNLDKWLSKSEQEEGVIQFTKQLNNDPIIHMETTKEVESEINKLKKSILELEDMIIHLSSRIEYLEEDSMQNDAFLYKKKF